MQYIKSPFTSDHEGGKIAAAVVLLLITVSPLSMTDWSAEAKGFNVRPAEANHSIPSLQRVAAITYLKEHKLYESLRSAHAARTQQVDNSILAPLFSEEQKLTASDAGAFDLFGFSVAVSGSIVVVGAWRADIGGNPNQGSAYVFNRQGGSWVEAQKLTASDGAAGDSFGFSVAISGSTIVVGAWLDDIGGNPDQGSAYVFNRQGGSWVETLKLTASDGAARSLFGSLVAVSNSTVVVVAPGLRLAYVYNREGESWVETQKLTASDREFNASFGSSVAMSGSTIVVGASGDNSVRGAAYVFNRQGGSWVETQKLTASDRELFDGFGISVAITGSAIVVGSGGDDIGGNIDQGSVYVFNRQGGSWVEEQKLTATDGGPGSFFGDSVAISGSTIVVGVPFKVIGGHLTGGSVYIFNRQGGSWVEAQQLTASEVFAFLGTSVAISGSTIVAGAQSSGNINQGSVHVFRP